MIHVHRTSALLSGPWLRKAARYMDEMEHLAAKEDTRRLHDLLSREAGILLKELREPLLRIFHDKCAYCESRIGLEATADIEHYRPKRDARGVAGERVPLHYWWLVFDEPNLLITCQVCNRMKASRFPIRGRRAPFGATGEKLAAEEPLLLHPCEDYPEEHLIFTEDGMCMGLTERGKVTIEILGLNRHALVEARREAWTETMFLLSTSGSGSDVYYWIDQVRRRLGNDQSYAAVRRQCVRRWMDQAAQRPNSTGLDLLPLLDAVQGTPGISEQVEREALREYEEQQRRQRSYSVETSDREQVESYYLGAKRIERIEIKNFRLIEDLVLDFPTARSEGEPWMVMLGENGVGKSSVLQGIALALMGEEHANRLGLDAARFFRRQAGKDEDGYVRVHLTNVGPVELRFTKGSSRFSVVPREPKVLVLGYGATRLLPREAGRAASGQKAVRILNLFNPTAPLSDTEAWLLDRKLVSDDRFREFTDALIPLLMLPEGARFHRDGSGVEIEHRGSRKPLRDLSDGYQSIVALMGDIAIGVSDKWELKDAEGIVLLDEIEVHLHPTWKISIVERLRKACPRLTFLVTTHEPLCLKGLAPEEIVVLKMTEDEQVYAETDIPSLTHLRVDQLLTSFLFDLDSTRDSVTGPMVARYSALLGKERRSRSEDRELQELQAALSKTLTSTVTPAQRRVEEAVRRVIGQIQEGASLDGLALEAEIRRQVGDLLGGEP